ncbi:Four helix bundle sensory module for signal transduction, partial [Geodermatophilus obscurus]
MTTAARPPRSRASWFADLPIAGKILSLILFSASIGVVLCVVAVGRIGALDESQQDMYQRSVVAFSDLDGIQATYEGVRQGYTSYFLADPVTRTALKAQLVDGRTTLDDQFEAYADITEHPDLFRTLRSDMEAYLDVSAAQMVAALDVGDVATAGAVAAGPLVQAQDTVTADLADLRTVLREEADAQAREGADEATSATVTLWTILAVSVGIGLVLALLVVRRIVRSVKSVQQSVDALAAGDLTVTPEVTGRDELGRMSAALGTAQASL